MAGLAAGAEAGERQLEAPAAADAPGSKGAQLVPIDMDAIYVALAYDAKVGPKAHAIIQQFFDNKVPILPLPKGIVSDRFDPKLNVVFWNSTAALQTASDSGAGTGKYISPALMLLDAISDSVAYARSPAGFARLSATPAPHFDSLEQQRIISGLNSQTQPAGADVDPILNDPNANGLENAAASALGEPVRTNDILVLQGMKAVEGVTFMTAPDPTWHKN